MGKIVAIGGGEIGRPGFPVETTGIDQEIVRLTGKERPRLLFLPTASSDSESYAKVVDDHFGGRIGCVVDTLCVLRDRPSKSEMERKVLGSDLVYVGGGNTLRMMMAWRRSGLDAILRQAYERGIVLSGLSAGAICWFKYGLSDSRKFTDKDAPFIKVSGLNLIEGLVCPHYDVEPQRVQGLKGLMRKVPGISLALENCSALEIVGDAYRIITSKPEAKAYKVFWRGGSLYQKPIDQTKEFLPISSLFSKVC